MANLKKLLELRKAKNKKNPNFDRVNSIAKIRLKNTWRRPRGRQNKTRRQFKSYLHMVKIGYGKPNATKGMHKSGLLPQTVHKVSDLNSINKETTGVQISSNVGQKKRVSIINKAKELGLKILNIRTEKYLNKVNELTEEKKAKKDSRLKKQKKKVTSKKDDKKTIKTEKKTNSKNSETKEVKKSKSENKQTESSKSENKKSENSEESKEKKDKDKLLTKRQV